MRRLTALVLLVLMSIESTGCHVYAWHQDGSPVPLAGQRRPNDVYRVTLTSGSVYEVTNIRFRSDSLLGMADSWKVVRGSTEYTAYPIAFPVDTVARVERRSFNPVFALGVAASSLAVFAVALNSSFHLNIAPR